MPKWLIVCLDGTWNTTPSPDSGQDEITNVLRFHDALASTSADGSEQHRRYDSGVGTNWWEKLSGGGFGKGIDRHIKNAYRWLSENYNSGDHIAIVGFSRGAYAARSLVGLMRTCWLLDRNSVHQAARKDSRRVEYATKYNGAMLSLSRLAYGIYRDGAGADGNVARDFRERYAQEIRVRFLGIWDTVGALGLPIEVIKKWLSPNRYAFHDTKLSGIVEHAYHAIAIDEHRVEFAVTLWERKPEHHVDQIMEQCWFSGSHADVGGGYGDHSLADISLHWMQKRAEMVGLRFSEESLMPSHGAYLGTIHDSYLDFLHPFPSMVTPRYHRPMGRTPGEIISSTVALRCSDDSNYKPQNEGFQRLLENHKNETGTFSTSKR